MLSKRFRGILVAIATLACATPAHAGGTKAQEIVIDQSAAGSTVALSPGQRLKVHLPGNPTTGFKWELVPAAGSILERQGEPSFTPGGSAPGAGGVYSFAFRAKAAGRTPLKFVYHRTFEKDAAPAGTFEVTVVIAK
jgi:inhibitor of cysteine peptidase